MSSSGCNLILDISGYSTIHKCRNEFGGGVAILISSCINYFKSDVDLDTIVKKLEEENINLECLAVKIESRSPFDLICYYCPKKLCSELFVELAKNKNFILVGDLNAKSTSTGNNSVKMV